MSSSLSFPASLLVLAACFGLTGAVFKGHFEVHGDLNLEYLKSQPITNSDTTENLTSLRWNLSDWSVNSELFSPLTSQSKQTVVEIETANSPNTITLHKCKFCSKAFKTIRGVLNHVGRMHKGETTTSCIEGCVDDDIGTTRKKTTTTTTPTTETTTTSPLSSTTDRVAASGRTVLKAGTNINIISTNTKLNTKHKDTQHDDDDALHGMTTTHCHIDNNSTFNSQATTQATTQPTRQQPHRACRLSTKNVNSDAGNSPVTGFSSESDNMPLL